MYNSKIIETLEKYYEILDEGFEKGLSEELGKNTAIKIADMIKAFYTYRKPSVIMKGEK